MFFIIYLIISTRISIIYFTYFYKTKINSKNEKIIRDYYEMNYTKGKEYYLNKPIYYYRDEKYSYEEWDIYGVYKKKKYKNYDTHHLRCYGDYKSQKLTYQERIAYFELELPIHIELIDKIKSDLARLDEEYDFVLISTIYYNNNKIDSLDFAVECSDYNDIFYECIYTIAEKYKMYFMFQNNVNFYVKLNDNYIDDTIIYEMFICIKKNTYTIFATQLYNLLRENKRQLDYSIIKLESGIDFFTKKEFRKKNHHLLFKENNKYLNCISYSFILFNYETNLHDYYMLGNYVNELNISNFYTLKLFYKLIYKKSLEKNYNYLSTWYKNARQKKFDKAIKLLKPIYRDYYVYIPSRFKLNCIKCFTIFIQFVINSYKKIKNYISYKSYYEKHNKKKQNNCNKYNKKTV